ncbi:winged helix-turn-helix transcriptional regulator [Deinococcus sp. Arct2-2]|uniref:MarR family winged helix-turn-helix transcriptional regulator n=1 Tax=Deinococcus sp. Arct2-2 TaxID=2568653 RepID=UPI0010A48CB6|nr:MarR family winged helix-turn-helix transcriptional regulator [Deinococcus sp. Arct2-2]THF68381.1 winged helix-turn-helix transcriptional regulator [Deinococcus sp. Arct2-2]
MAQVPPAPNARRASTGRPAVLAWLRMLHVTQRISKAWNELLKEHQLSPAQFNVIATIGGQPGLTQRDLSEKLLVTQGNTSQLMLNLGQRQLIERRPVGREKLLHLTPTGQALFDALVPAHEDWLVEQFGILTAEEQAQLALVLRRLERAQR